MASRKEQIKFNKKIYHYEAVVKTVKAFQKLAIFSIKEDQDNIVVYSETSPVVENINNEFANYVLAETISIK